MLSILLHTGAKKEGLPCFEYQVGFLYNYKIKRAFLLFAFLVTRVPYALKLHLQEGSRGSEDIGVGGGDHSTRYFTHC